MHTIILPYFCDAEIDRYELILKQMTRLGPQQVGYEFLLASSPRIAPSDRLMAAAQRVAPSRHFACPSQVFGYPQGPSAMFWDCMEHLAETNQGGFGLWMESDMCPVKSDWLERLDRQWNACGDIYVMGCVVPAINLHARGSRLVEQILGKRYRHEPWIPQHVNGGACYRRDLVRHMPADYRDGLFDVRLGEILRNLGGYADTPAIGFSTLERLESDLADPQKALLHGYLQDKEAFLHACMGQSQQGDGTRPILRGFLGTRKQHRAKPKLDAVLSIKDRQPAVLTVYRRLAA